MLQADLHTHSIASGHTTPVTISNMASYARQLGLRILGISDHSPATPNAAKASYFRSLYSAPRKRDGIDLYYGAEVSIMSHTGKLDLPDDILNKLDYAIVSIHHPFLKPGSCRQNTDAYLAAMEHPGVRIIGHCDDARYDVDYSEILKTAMAKNIILEINNTSLFPEQFRGDTSANLTAILQLCSQYQYPVLLSSDSHTLDQIGDVSLVEAFLKKQHFPDHLILNNSYHDCSLWLKQRDISL